MKRGYLKLKFCLVMLILVLIFPFTSSQILVNQQPRGTYNLGDVISVPITIKTISGISGFLNMDLICGGVQTNFFRDGVQLPSGEEKRFEASLVLVRGVIGDLKGTCRIKAYVGDKHVLTEEFLISNKIVINTEVTIQEFNPEGRIPISGQAIKENGKPVNGFIETTILIEGNAIINQSETVKNGLFSFNVEIPGNMPAGTHSINLKVYELDNINQITNQGLVNKVTKIRQIPNSLEVFFESREVIPGNDLRVKAILYDQTGEKIESNAKLIIKNQNDKVVKEIELETDEFFNLWVPKNEFPNVWKVSVFSGGFNAESNFKILENEEISLDLIGKTLIITNIGNVPYEKKSEIKIGNKSLEIDVSLGIGESQKYLLSAPDGEYEVEIISGDYSTSMQVALTGKAIDIKALTSRSSIFQNPFVWLFVIFILAFVIYIILRKGYQRTFIGYIKSKVKKDKIERKTKEMKTKNLASFDEVKLTKPKNLAEILLSIKGDKQDVSVVAVNIKNIKEVQLKEGLAKETIQKIVDFAEENKAVTNESYNTLFFIISPTKTRTFNNEIIALEIAQKAKEIILKHNKMFKQKMDFGISLNYGTIIAKPEKESFKFMSLGNLMAQIKKISSIAENDILICEKMNDRIRSKVKTEKHEKDNLSYYSIKEIKKDSEEYKKFIRKFLDRQNKDKK